MNIKKIVLVFIIMLAQFSLASIVGYSTHPYKTNDKQHLSGEVYSDFSRGSGLGAQVRYSNILNSTWNFDGGLGVSSSDNRRYRLFAGADYMIFPDYHKQPRFSLKGSAEFSDYEDTNLFVLGVTPTLSKAFSFWGKVAYPYIALPTRLGFETSDNRYKFLLSAAVGITSDIPLKGFEKLSANLEASVGLSNTPTSLLLGLSMPL